MLFQLKYMRKERKYSDLPGRVSEGVGEWVGHTSDVTVKDDVVLVGVPVSARPQFVRA